MTDNRNNTDAAALDMLSGASAKHAVVWDPTEPAATRPLLLQTPSGWYTYGFDQSKNVTELFDSSGNIAAIYGYGPFGEDMTASGPAAALNPFRFSSEIWDATLGLVQYNYRSYNPINGRFITRDPIGEDEGLNLYAIVGNDPVNRWDYLGLAVTDTVRVIGGLNWNEYNAQVRLFGQDPGIVLGLTAVAFDAQWECVTCKESGDCSKLSISKDTYLEGVVLWLNTTLKTRSGRTIGQHENKHLDHARTNAELFDDQLHRVADGSCVLKKCCSAQKKYMHTVIMYYYALTAYEDALLDEEDYYGGDAANASIVRDQKRQKMETALQTMSQSGSAMAKDCE